MVFISSILMGVVNLFHTGMIFLRCVWKGKEGKARSQRYFRMMIIMMDLEI